MAFFGVEEPPVDGDVGKFKVRDVRERIYCNRYILYRIKESMKGRRQL